MKTLLLDFVPDAGLANQLFEYAAAHSIARTLDIPLQCTWQPSTRREFGLHHFGITPLPYQHHPLLVNRPGQGHRKHFKRAVELVKASGNEVCAIRAAFQDEACFIDHADEIRELFHMEPFDLPHPAGTTPVGVQVRRGDYVKHPKLNVTTPEYFMAALEWMRGHVENPHFLVVSDDPHHCQRLFEKQMDVTVMPEQSAIDGLRTLASCEAHVISNSTFGWWGAWLGESGPVIAPEHWHHQPGSYGDWTPVPDRWIKIPNGMEIRKTAVKPIIPRVVTVLPDPQIERAIVFPWHADQAKWHELRYSLRSIEKHFEDKKCPILIFGTRRPGFIVDGGRVEYRGAFTYTEALSNGVQVADKVMWCNDDTILLKPTTWADCEIPYYLRPVGEDFLKNAVINSNPWREGCLRVLRQLAKRGLTDHRVYSTHLPYVWEREKALKVFEEFGIWEKFPMELAYFHLFPEGARQLDGERTEDLPDDTARFLNFADRHLTNEFKTQIANLFPDFAAWEVKCQFT